MSIVKLGKRRQVVLPLEVCKEVGIDEGEYLEVGVKEGAVVMKPKVFIDKKAEAREEAWKRIDAKRKELQEAFKDMSDEEFEKLIDKAVIAVRQRKKTLAKQKP